MMSLRSFLMVKLIFFSVFFALASAHQGRTALIPHGYIRRSSCSSSSSTSCPASCELQRDSCPSEETRRTQAYWIRVEAANANFLRPVPCHDSNGDEERYSTKIASFSKGLPHDSLGHVLPAAYDSLLHALATGLPDDFEKIPLAGVRKLVNPQAGQAFDLEGIDAHAGYQAPAPAFASAQQAGEIVESYWMALLRDTSFSKYDSSALAATAAADLRKLSDYRGPTIAAMLFRGVAPGCGIGPYVSQFLYLPCPFGANFVDQTLTPPTSGQNFVTSWDDYLRIQNGAAPTQSLSYLSPRRHIINGRDLSHWVHIDVLFQAYFHAMLVLTQSGAPAKKSNPYYSSRTQDGFGTFGGPHIATLTAEGATRALKAVWFQKWYVHRRLRPEVFAARVDRHVRGFTTYPLHNDVLSSSVLAILNSTYDSFLLPQAFPEGSPIHPSYGAGHATVAGACTTILKAWFNESFVLPFPVTPSADGGALLPFVGPQLTVGGELNKLAANVAIGRNIAGVHWHSDATESLKLGEQIAISVLRDQKKTYAEAFTGWSFTSFDNKLISI